MKRAKRVRQQHENIILYSRTDKVLQHEASAALGAFLETGSL